MEELNLSIQLINIDLSKVTIVEQMSKADEEKKELEDAVLLYTTKKSNNEDMKEIENERNHVIEEFWDTVQANLGILDKIGINAQEVMEGYPEHLVKLKDRPRVKGE
ncbi:hypothetical protein FDB24_14840 [Clostridium botulinum]|uniref:hypothetical protein n=1 Tax=Clostridium botulinum TaxID=1491 RepID=UPI0007730709|nr:hypothetical protein [Clostridium botulinum]NFL87496.1 hypothetical protein [Clostridium botulinum]NFO22508.1 hypothetical protein [Clostridium botulinum]